MKKLFSLAIAIFFSLTTYAQDLKATNTSCQANVDVTVEGVYWDGTTCITLPLGTISVGTNTGVWTAPATHPSSRSHTFVTYSADIETCPGPPAFVINNVGDPTIWPNCTNVVAGAGAPGCAPGCAVLATVTYSAPDWILTIY